MSLQQRRQNRLAAIRYRLAPLIEHLDCTEEHDIAEHLREALAIIDERIFTITEDHTLEPETDPA